MEKNRIRPVVSGKTMRMSYQRQEEVLDMPNLIEVQKDSYKWFLEEGFREALADISPITDYSGRLSLEFVDYVLAEDEIKHTIEECKERDLTYEAPVKIKVRLHNKEKEDITEHEIFMGNFPLMTETGTLRLLAILAHECRPTYIVKGIGKSSSFPIFFNRWFTR